MNESNQIKYKKIVQYNFHPTGRSPIIESKLDSNGDVELKITRWGGMELSLIIPTTYLEGTSKKPGEYSVYIAGRDPQLLFKGDATSIRENIIGDESYRKIFWISSDLQMLEQIVETEDIPPKLKAMLADLAGMEYKSE